MVDPCEWRQITIRFSEPQRAEHHAITCLAPVLMRAESAGLITSWFFIRKQWWRFRYLPADDTSAHEMGKLLHDAVEPIQEHGHITQWAEPVYEPERHAFGGESGMALAHHLFHADSHHILAHLAKSTTDNRAKRRELSILLCAALIRAAGQDRYEQGDVWAKAAALRPTETIAQPAHWDAFKAAIRRLITVDTGPETALRISELRFADAWLTAFERTGRALRVLADEGTLTRGLRATAAHHMIFHWNRLGLPYQAQANMALAATEAIFDGCSSFSVTGVINR